MSFTPEAPPGAPPVGTPENPLQLDDPRMMRALAHPARIAILQHLAVDGPATATECAQVTGLSPSACSYHLRALATYGFVEEDRAATADGRQRPWRARIISVTVEDKPGQPEAVRAAGRLLQDTLEADMARIREHYRNRSAEYPAEWRAAAGGVLDILHVTASELEALRNEMRELLGRYRRLDPAERPPGAQRVRAELDLVPWFDPAATS